IGQVLGQRSLAVLLEGVSQSMLAQCLVGQQFVQQLLAAPQVGAEGNRLTLAVGLGHQPVILARLFDALAGARGIREAAPAVGGVVADGLLLERLGHDRASFLRYTTVVKSAAIGNSTSGRTASPCQPSNYSVTITSGNYKGRNHGIEAGTVQDRPPTGG